MQRSLPILFARHPTGAGTQREDLSERLVHVIVKLVGLTDPLFEGVDDAMARPVSSLGLHGDERTEQEGRRKHEGRSSADNDASVRDGQAKRARWRRRDDGRDRPHRGFRDSDKFARG
jgi:hypothetical protein